MSPRHEVRNSANLIGRSGEVEVFLRDAAGVVGNEGEADLVLAYVDIGVVASGFGEVADLVDEGEGGAEVLEEEGAHQFPRFDLPVGDCDEAGMDFVIGESGHGVLLKGLVRGTADLTTIVCDAWRELKFVSGM